MKEKVKDLLLLIFVVVVVLLLITSEHVFIAFSVLLIYSLYKLYPERFLLEKIIKSVFTIKFYNVVIWFISYLLTLKMLSVIYSVDEEYLKFSPAIVTIPISFCVSYFLLVLLAGISRSISMVTGNIISFLPQWIKVSYEQSMFVRVVNILQYLVIVVAIPFLLAALSSVYLARVAILSDASFISDCGTKQWRVMYLRKNNNECYKFTLNINVFSEQPVIVNSKK
ncbi:hypothetical protein FFB58_05595 [Enterobacter sp. MF024]|uniref:hypothetical protein n=1 Tax=Enterobacter sp. MF024 TaxID=2555644 RepID=UPI0011059439|nr:hypothetical protein [Enterobacter sp. MF024]TLU69251.1 hypothetical protein FFB58_05595 [Enterobacter sp. MF024]